MERVNEGGCSLYMQEPQQWQQSAQEWQESDTFSAEDAQRYEQQQFSQIRGEDNPQRQKIYPPGKLSWHRLPRGITALILLSSSFILAAIGLALTAMMTNYFEMQGEQWTVITVGMLCAVIIIIVYSVIAVVTAAALLIEAIRRWVWIWRLKMIPLANLGENHETAR